MFSLLIRFISSTFFYGGPVFILVTGLLAWTLTPFFGPVEAENASFNQIMCWLAAKDVTKLPEKAQAALVNRIEKLINKDVGSKESNKKPYPLELSGYFKMLVKSGLEAYKKELSDPNNAKIASNFVDRNIKNLVKIWYIQQMNKYDNATPKEQQVVMTKLVKNLKNLQEFNDYVYKECELNTLSIPERLNELELTFRFFKETSPPAEYAKMLDFRRKIEIAYVKSEVGNQMEKFLTPFFK
ncbi:MAG: hypothetical protein ACRC2T_09250 [Thermoguttaceae bacterium]